MEAGLEYALKPKCGYHPTHTSLPGVRRARGVLSDELTRPDEWTECLIAVQKQRDVDAFSKLFRHFAPRIKAFLMKSGATEALAEDTMQEAMAQVWRKAALFDPAIATASTWIFTVVRNKQIDAIRKQRRPEPEELHWGPEEPENPSDIVAASQEEALLRRALATLPDQQRTMIEKAYYGDLSHSEIAEMTGLPLGTIKSRIRLGLERLRHEMNQR